MLRESEEWYVYGFRFAFPWSCGELVSEKWVEFRIPKLFFEVNWIGNVESGFLFCFALSVTLSLHISQKTCHKLDFVFECKKIKCLFHCSSTHSFSFLPLFINTFKFIFLFTLKLILKHVLYYEGSHIYLLVSFMLINDSFREICMKIKVRNFKD